MTLSELVDDRKQIFRRPKTLKEIQKGRRLLEVTSFSDIVPTHEKRKSTEAIVLHSFKIIPPGFYSAQNFSKRGALVELDTFNGDEARLIEEKLSPRRAREEAEKSGKYSPEDGPFVGWTWIDPEGRNHIVHPTTVIEGHRIHMYALKSRSIRDQIELRVYSASDSNLRTIKALVPSRSGEKKHEVVIEHVTDLDDPERFVEWTRLETRHECPHKRNDFSFRFKKTVTYCPHDTAAYAAHSRRVGEEKRRVIFQPFPLFTEPYLRLFFGLAYHTVIVDTEIKGGKPTSRTRPPTFPEIDAVLMDAWLTKGDAPTLFVPTQTKTYSSGPSRKGKKMRDYIWSPDTPGMQFEQRPLS
ncbi:MAG: hypothetical protein IIA87_03035 [Nanoarchaeota archaeon]|nr:hypothetical protein [Nanoarchaeota archaeon]